MKTDLFLMPGQPEKVAARAALRLAWWGDQIEPVSPTEFVWKPQPAERKLFRCPPWVEVECLAAPNKPGHVLVRLRWKQEGWLARWGAGVSGLFGAGLGALLLKGGALLSLAGLAAIVVPAVVGVALGIGLSSNWMRRIRSCCQQGGTLSLDSIENADRWLELDEAQRAEVLRVLRRKAVDTPPVPGQSPGRDERSAATLLGWPLWHTAWGIDPVTGRYRVARGWYARGQLAEGLVALGQIARGHFAFGQLAIGKFIAVGQAAFAGLIALGQAAVGGLLGIGLLGAGIVATGLAALGVIIAGIHGQDPLALPLLLAFALVFVPLALIGAFSLRSWLHRTEVQVLEEEIALAEGKRSPRPDEYSLSRSSLHPSPRVDERSLSVSSGPEEGNEELSTENPERLAETVEEDPVPRQRVDG